MINRLKAGPTAVARVLDNPKEPIPSASLLFGTISETMVPEAFVVALNPIPCILLRSNKIPMEKARTV